MGKYSLRSKLSAVVSDLLVVTLAIIVCDNDSSCSKSISAEEGLLKEGRSVVVYSASRLASVFVFFDDDCLAVLYSYWYSPKLISLFSRSQ